MKLRIASLVILCLALAASPAWASSRSYDNGAINGTVNAWNIGMGLVVSDSFNAGGTVNGFEFGIWDQPGDLLLSVDWSITHILQRVRFVR
jgi:hypothetical protein